MRARMVFEKFKEESDPIKDMGIGYSDRTLNSKSFKILLFIQSKGKEGAGLTEIQRFIWTELDGYSEESFWERSPVNKWEPNKKPGRASRGHWNTQLFGGRYYHDGLLNKYCTQNPTTKKWVLDHLPKTKEAMYNWRYR